MKLSSSTESFKEKHDQWLVSCSQFYCDRKAVAFAEALRNSKEPMTEKEIAKEVKKEIYKFQFKIKKEKDPNRVKKSPNGYLLYCNNERELIKSRNEDAKTDFALLNKILGNSWGKLSEAERDEWKEKAKIVSE